MFKSPTKHQRSRRLLVGWTHQLRPPAAMLREEILQSSTRRQTVKPVDLECSGRFLERISQEESDPLAHQVLMFQIRRTQSSTQRISADPSHPTLLQCSIKPSQRNPL